MEMGDAVSLGNPPNLQLQSFSIAAWIKRSSTVQASPDGGGGMILAYGQGGYGLAVLDDGQLRLTKIGVSKFDSRNFDLITDTQFHHVAVTKVGRNIAFYVDGVGISFSDVYDPDFG